MLVVGLTGLTAELIKNIVLAGIKSLTLIDHRNSDDITVNTIQGATFLLLPSQHSESTPVSYGIGTNEHVTLPKVHCLCLL